MANFFLHNFCKPLWQVPFWALTSSEIKVTVAPETSQILFACTAAALSTPNSVLPSFDSFVPCLFRCSPASLPLVLPAIKPNQLQPIPDSVPADVKILLQKYPSILRTRDVKPPPLMGLIITSTPAATPQVLQNLAALIQKNLRLPKRNSKSPWGSPLHMVPKKMDHGGLVAITVV
jgi:hypothetical protein